MSKKEDIEMDKVPQQGIVCLLYQTYPPGSMFN